MQKGNELKINSESINIDFFKKTTKFILKRREVRGLIIGMTGLLTAFGMASSISDSLNARNEQSVAVADEVEEGVLRDSNVGSATHFGGEIALVGLGASTQANPYEVNLDEVNSMNLIINDNKFSSNLFNEICEKLHDDGLSFTVVHDCEGIDVDEAVVITLDQQYLSGPGMVIFAPNDNERLGDSDALALAMESGFKENDFEVDAVNAGKIGYKESKMGGFQSRIATSTENAIGTDKNTSFVTVAFGTNNFDVRNVADSIESALARYAYYQHEKAYGEDLIYRIEGGDMMGDLQKRFDGVSSREILDYNNLENENRIPMDQTLKNPNVENMIAFSDNNLISLNVNKTNRY